MRGWGEGVFGGECLTASANGRRKRTPPTGGPLSVNQTEGVFGGEYLTVSANGRRKRTPPTGGPLSVNQAEGVFGEVRKRFF